MGVAILALPVAVSVVAGILSCRAHSPEGITEMADCFRRFGDPDRIRVIEKNGRTYYEFQAHLSPAWQTLALPSSPPAYVFDENGRLVEWCCDPGDSTAYQQRWPYGQGREANLTEIKERFGK